MFFRAVPLDELAAGALASGILERVPSALLGLRKKVAGRGPSDASAGESYTGGGAGAAVGLERSFVGSARGGASAS